MDTSQYSPTFIMISFVAFMLALGLPSWLGDLMAHALKAFNAKIFVLPAVLNIVDWCKYEDKGDETKNNLKVMIDNSDRSAIMLTSGMGQGMFFFFAALLVNAKIMMTITYVYMVLEKLKNEGDSEIAPVEFKTQAQAASDDVTLYLLIASNSARMVRIAIGLPSLIEDAQDTCDQEIWTRGCNPKTG
eukprot:4026742-Pyramimonas_sp.AAC.1